MLVPTNLAVTVFLLVFLGLALWVVVLTVQELRREPLGRRLATWWRGEHLGVKVFLILAALGLVQHLVTSFMA